MSRRAVLTPAQHRWLWWAWALSQATDGLSASRKGLLAEEPGSRARAAHTAGLWFRRLWWSLLLLGLVWNLPWGALSLVAVLAQLAAGLVIGLALYGLLLVAVSVLLAGLLAIPYLLLGEKPRAVPDAGEVVWLRGALWEVTDTHFYRATLKNQDGAEIVCDLREASWPTAADMAAVAAFAGEAVRPRAAQPVGSGSSGA